MFDSGDLLAVDPSLTAPGAALFRNGILLAAERVKIDRSYTQMDRGERCSWVANDIFCWGLRYYGMRPTTLVFEWPQIYSVGKSKSDPNDLVSLAAIGADLAGKLTGTLLTRITPTPAEWIGQCPKRTTGDPWTSPRGVRIKSRLSTEEFKRVVPSHDAVDAVGLGLYALGRLDRKRVFSGASE
jgi:hypothetical protein